MPGRIPYVSRTSIWKAWKAVRKELKNSSIRDVVDFLDYDVNPDKWINDLLNRIKRGTYEPEPPRIFSLGKSKGFTRTMTFPAVPDLVLYRSLVDCIFQKAKRREHKHVYFLRAQVTEVHQQVQREPAPPHDGCLPQYRAASRRSFLNWLKYDQYRKYLIFKRVHPYLVVTDISTFFDSVLHSHVAEALHGLSVPARTVGLLFFLLERLSIRREYTGSHGISLPIDEFDCSRTLAHMLLFSHDDEMVKLVGEDNYVRWMDDQIMGVSSRAQGWKVLSEVGRSLASLHLSPNVEKSKVLSLSEARRHFHLDLNKLLDEAEEIAKQIEAGTASKRALRKKVSDIWQKAKAHEGVGEFGKVLKRLYRLAALAGSRRLRRRARRDILSDPSLAERICHYLRCTGTVKEYLAFADSLMKNPEQVYPNVNVALVESLLRLEPSPDDSKSIRKLALDMLSQKLRIPGAEHCAAIAPLLLLRFGDRRSLPCLMRMLKKVDGIASPDVVRACAIVYASFGEKYFREVRQSASRLLRNNLSQTVRLLEQISCYSEVPKRYKSRLYVATDSVAGRKYIDMRVALMARLLLMSKSEQVKKCVDDWTKSILAEPISQYDKRLITRLVRKDLNTR
jgi:hypothetical protein